MEQKVILILVDGFRPDALTSCGNSYGSHLLTLGSYSLTAETVYPSVTLPSHMSLFHSVTPQRHGILTNTFVPMSRPIEGLCERLRAADKTCAFFYNWGQLRDVALPASLAYSYFVSGTLYGYEKANEMVTENALSFIASEKPDFAFVYLGCTDRNGHDYGWMSREYLQACSLSLDEIRRLVERFGEEYNIIVMADHGGHERNHGTQMPEDMTIPIICMGESFCPGRRLEKVSICDVAPTIAELCGIRAVKDWEGKSML